MPRFGGLVQTTIFIGLWDNELDPNVNMVTTYSEMQRT